MINISTIKTSKPVLNNDSLQSQSFSLLDSLSVGYQYVENDAVHTMDECLEIEKVLETEIRKTIVLCNRKKTQFYLVIMPSSKAFNSKAFAEKVGGERLSFAKADKMEELLGIQPGSATIMSLINDKEERVQLVIDREILKDEWFACNPGTNTFHVKLKTHDLMDKVIPALNHQPMLIEL